MIMWGNLGAELRAEGIEPKWLESDFGLPMCDTDCSQFTGGYCALTGDTTAECGPALEVLRRHTTPGSQDPDSGPDYDAKVGQHLALQDRRRLAAKVGDE